MISSSDDLLQRFQKWELPETVDHPSLYLSRGELPAARAKAQTLQALLQPIEETARARMDNPSASPRSVMAEQLALLYLLTGRESYAECARKAVSAILDEEDWVHHAHKPLRVDLGVAHTTRVLAEVYDALYDVMSEEERDRLRRAIISRGLDLFLSIAQARSEWWTGSQNNWRSVICGEMGTAALCLADVYPSARECIDLAVTGVLSLLDLGGKDGGYFEGIGYWSYGIGEAVRFSEVLSRLSAGSVDLFEHPYLGIAGDFGLYCTTGDAGCFNFSDGGYETANTTLMARLASRYRNPLWQWLVNRYSPTDPYGFLWIDPDLPALAPPAEGGSKLFGSIDLAVMRTGWQATDLFTGIKSGWTTGPHCHLDANGIILNAFGERLIVESDPWFYAHYQGFFDYWGGRWRYEGLNSLGHNTIVVDGHGQDFEVPAYGDRYSHRRAGKILRFQSSEAFDYAVSDASYAYGDRLKRFVRYVVLMESGYVVVLDDLKSLTGRAVESRWHYNGKVTGIGDGWARIGQAKVGLLVKWADASGLPGWQISDQRRLCTYPTASGRASHERRFLSCEPFRAIIEGQLVTLLYPYLLSEGTVDPVLRVSRDSEDPETAKIVTVEVETGGRCDRISFNLAYWQQGGTVFVE